MKRPARFRSSSPWTANGSAPSSIASWAKGTTYSPSRFPNRCSRPTGFRSPNRKPRTRPTKPFAWHDGSAIRWRSRSSRPRSRTRPTWGASTGVRPRADGRGGRHTTRTVQGPRVRLKTPSRWKMESACPLSASARIKPTRAEKSNGPSAGRWNWVIAVSTRPAFTETKRASAEQFATAASTAKTSS